MLLLRKGIFQRKPEEISGAQKNYREVKAMLSIGRKSGESVMIGDNICDKVISVDGMLRLAIEAPKEIPIVRGELYEKNRTEPSRSAERPNKK